jgi:hypothetical protein
MSITEAKNRSLKENDMKDKVPISGRVKVEITRADGTVDHIPEHSNDIENSLKAMITDSLQAAQTFGISQTALFDGSYFSSVPNGQSGIVVHTNSNDYETECTETTSGLTAYQYQYIGIVRASNQKVLTGAKLGYNWSTSSFTTLHATDSFSTTLEDGDQLTITWTITLADA